MPKQPVVFKMLLQIINAVLSIMNENGYKIYDADNPDYFIQRVYYCKDDDRIKFTTEED